MAVVSIGSGTYTKLQNIRQNVPDAASRIIASIRRIDPRFFGNCPSLACASLARPQFVNALTQLARIGDVDAQSVLKEIGIDSDDLEKIEMPMLHELQQKKGLLYPLIKEVQDQDIRELLHHHYNELGNDVRGLQKAIENKKFSFSEKLIDRYNDIVQKFNAIRSILLSRQIFSETLIESIPGTLGIPLPLSGLVELMKGLEQQTIQGLIADIKGYSEGSLNVSKMRLIHDLLDRVNKGELSGVPELLREYKDAAGALGQSEGRIDALGDELEILADKIVVVSPSPSPTLAPTPTPTPAPAPAPSGAGPVAAPKMEVAQIVLAEEKITTTISDYLGKINEVFRLVHAYADKNNGNIELLLIPIPRRQAGACFETYDQLLDWLEELNAKIGSGELHNQSQNLLKFLKMLYEEKLIPARSGELVFFQMESPAAPVPQRITVTPAGVVPAAESEEPTDHGDAAVAAVAQVAKIGDAGEEGQGKRKYFEALYAGNPYGWKLDFDPLLGKIENVLRRSDFLGKNLKGALQIGLIDGMVCAYKALKNISGFDERINELFDNLEAGEVVYRMEIIGWINELMRIKYIAENHPNDPVSEIEPDFGKINYATHRIREKARGDWKVYTTNTIREKKVIADAYRPISRTLVEIKCATRAGWLISGVMQPKEEKRMFQFFDQAASYARLIEDGEIDQVELYVTAPEVSPKVIDELRKIFADVGGLKLFLFRDILDSEPSELVIDMPRVEASSNGKHSASEISKAWLFANSYYVGTRTIFEKRDTWAQIRDKIRATNKSFLIEGLRNDLLKIRAAAGQSREDLASTDNLYEQIDLLASQIRGSNLEKEIIIGFVPILIEVERLADTYRLQ
ncbi:MAG: hypothetical protein HQ564_00575 [Candidatus Saganbacteria bacterium]|nr:hypothetical protein [Candidatus Saganbacteria bacterium]